MQTNDASKAGAAGSTGTAKAVHPRKEVVQPEKLLTGEEIKFTQTTEFDSAVENLYQEGLSIAKANGHNVEHKDFFGWTKEAKKFLLDGANNNKFPSLRHGAVSLAAYNNSQSSEPDELKVDNTNTAIIRKGLTDENLLVSMTAAAATSTTENIPLMYEGHDFLQQIYQVQHKAAGWSFMANHGLNMIEEALAKMGRPIITFPRVENHLKENQ